MQGRAGRCMSVQGGEGRWREVQEGEKGEKRLDSFGEWQESTGRCLVVKGVCKEFREVHGGAGRCMEVQGEHEVPKLQRVQEVKCVQEL